MIVPNFEDWHGVRHLAGGVRHLAGGVRLCRRFWRELRALLRPGRHPALPETFGLLGAPTPLVSGTLGFAGVRHPAHFDPHSSCIFAAAATAWPPRLCGLPHAIMPPLQDFRTVVWRDNCPVESCKSYNPVENLPHFRDTGLVWCQAPCG